MKKFGNILFVMLLLLMAASLAQSCKSENKDVEVEEPVQLELKFKVVEGKVEGGQTFGALLAGLGLPTDYLQRVLDSSKALFDVRKIRVGNGYKAVYSPDGGELLQFIYDIDRYTHIKYHLKDSIYAERVTDERTRNLRHSTVTVESSLWNDVKRAGASPLLALKISDIYAWTIDFFSLQRGDNFTVLYDELEADDGSVEIADIWYVEFNHAGKLFTAVNYLQEEKGNRFWSENGESLRKAFLKAPLNFFRITSKFTYNRKHPVLKIVRPHTGVDYAAPKGTPVMTIGDGVITFKGWAGGGGNTIKIKHNSVYMTSYMHLSGYAKGLKVGSRVRQGEVIGYVGSTGLSTGPHLDFRVYKNGKPIDPLKMESPSAEPISKQNMESFTATMQEYRRRLDSLLISEHVEGLINIL